MTSMLWVGSARKGTVDSDLTGAVSRAKAAGLEVNLVRVGLYQLHLVDDGKVGFRSALDRFLDQALETSAVLELSHDGKSTRTRVTKATVMLNVRRAQQNERPAVAPSLIGSELDLRQLAAALN